MNVFIVSPHLGDKWKEIQRKYIEKYTEGDYSYIQYDVLKNAHQTDHHLRSLGEMLARVKKHAKERDMIIFIDSDAFPIRKGWIKKVRGFLDQPHVSFFAVQRKENPTHKQHPHPCFCGWYHGTSILFKQFCCNPYISNWKIRKWIKLKRTNKVNLHKQLYGIYSDMVFHCGAGSRSVEHDKFFAPGLKHEKDFWADSEKFIRRLTGEA